MSNKINSKGACLLQSEVIVALFITLPFFIVLLMLFDVLLSLQERQFVSFLFGSLIFITSLIISVKFYVEVFNIFKADSGPFS